MIAGPCAAIDGVVKVLQNGVAFALEVLGRIDAALRTNRVRTLHRNDGKEVDDAASLGNLDDRG
jgi:hypothetical protein